MNGTFLYHGHELKAKQVMDETQVSCQTCSIPMVIVSLVAIMMERHIRSIIVDGTEIKRLY
jgi:hypothetical protein